MGICVTPWLSPSVSDLQDWVSTRERWKLSIKCTRTKASKRVDTIDVHRTAATYALATAPSKRQRWVDLVLDPNQRVKHHRSRLVEIKGVGLHPWLIRWFIGVPAVDMELLDLGILARHGFFDSRGLAGRIRFRAGGSSLADRPYGVDGGK